MISLPPLHWQTTTPMWNQVWQTHGQTWGLQLVHKPLEVVGLCVCTHQLKCTEFACVHIHMLVALSIRFRSKDIHMSGLSQSQFIAAQKKSADLTLCFVVDVTAPECSILHTWSAMPGWAAATEILLRGEHPLDMLADISTCAFMAIDSLSLLHKSDTLPAQFLSISLAATVQKLIFIQMQSDAQQIESSVSSFTWLTGHLQSEFIRNLRPFECFKFLEAAVQVLIAAVLKLNCSQQELCCNNGRSSGGCTDSSNIKSSTAGSSKSKVKKFDRFTLGHGATTAGLGLQQNAQDSTCQGQMSALVPFKQDSTQQVMAILLYTLIQISNTQVCFEETSVQLDSSDSLSEIRQWDVGALRSHLLQRQAGAWLLPHGLQKPGGYERGGTEDSAVQRMQEGQVLQCGVSEGCLDWRRSQRCVWDIESRVVWDLDGICGDGNPTCVSTLVGG